MLLDSILEPYSKRFLICFLCLGWQLKFKYPFIYIYCICASCGPVSFNDLCVDLCLKQVCLMLFTDMHCSNCVLIVFSTIPWYYYEFSSS